MGKIHVSKQPKRTFRIQMLVLMKLMLFFTVKYWIIFKTMHTLKPTWSDVTIGYFPVLFIQ